MSWKNNEIWNKVWKWLDPISSHSLCNTSRFFRTVRDKHNLSRLMVEGTIFVGIACHLTMQDLMSLSQTSKEMYLLFQNQPKWHAMHQLWFKQDWKSIFQLVYLSNYLCRNSYQLNNNTFICTMSPVYHHTQCSRCNKVKLMCGACSDRENSSRHFCNKCNMFISICRNCDVNGGKVIDNCWKCKKEMCLMHFVDLDACGHKLCHACWRNAELLCGNKKCRDNVHYISYYSTFKLNAKHDDISELPDFEYSWDQVDEY